MNVPALAKKTFEELRFHVEFMSIVDSVLKRLRKISNASKRARHVHKVIDDYNKEVFSHPLVQQLSPCRLGCTACCHTQVSVTDDEAELLARKINDGLEIDQERLRKQSLAGDDGDAFFRLSYQDRKCIFLSDEGACRVYEDRPSVCRTNAVLGTPDQCDTSVSFKPIRVVKTQKSDMAIYASFLHAKTSGTLPHMISKILAPKNQLSETENVDVCGAFGEGRR